ncbi:MAG TPA: hypothetical protein VGR96_13805 [Acidobacteriaceae bacterium]|nr:hypothetical protein [Acidobacteriaceae bacterium]
MNIEARTRRQGSPRLGTVAKLRTTMENLRRTTYNVSIDHDSSFFPGSTVRERADCSTGCVKGIIWACGFQAAALLVAVILLDLWR